MLQEDFFLVEVMEKYAHFMYNKNRENEGVVIVCP